MDTKKLNIQNQINEPIAIVGMACRFPGAPSINAYWELLAEGKSSVTEVPPDRWSLDDFYEPEEGALGKMNTPYGAFLPQLDGFDAAFFSMSDHEAAAMDPQQRLLMELSWEAFSDGGVTRESLKGQDVGVFIGVSSADYAQTRLKRPKDINMYSITGVSASVIANRLSYFYDLRGPSQIVDTACSSSLVSIHQACQSLHLKECKMALAGGVNIILSPLISIGFAQAYVTSPDGKCRAFDAGANGIVRGEGAGAVLLKPLSAALKDKDRIYAVIQGSATGQDGFTNGLTAPNPAGQRAVLDRAYEKSQIQPKDVQYIEAHGTGTKLGDPIEAKALSDVLCKNRSTPLILGSVKSNLGHLEAASGMAGLIKTVLSLHHQALPPSLHFETPNPFIGFERKKLKVQTEFEPCELRCAGVSAFGFGGTNAHVVLTKAPAVNSDIQSVPGPALLPVSAHLPEALKAQMKSLETELPKHPLSAWAQTLWKRQTHLKYRALYFASEIPEWIEGKAARKKTVFIFSGMGSQAVAMGRQLLAQPVFLKAIKDVDFALGKHQDWSVLQYIEEGFEFFPEIVQPLIFAIQVALVKLWDAYGVRPDKVMGSSMGEVAAAYCAGCITLDTACAVINRRIHVLKQMEGEGSLAVVGLPAEEIQSLLDAHSVYIVAINSPSMTVIAGLEDDLKKVCQTLESQEVFVRAVKGATAPSHTPLVEPLKDEFLAALQDYNGQIGHTDFYSTAEAKQVSGENLNAHYWWQNVRQPIQMIPTVEAIENESPHLYIEISPHPVVLNGLKELGDNLGYELPIFPSLRRDDIGVETFLNSVGHLFVNGQDISFDSLSVDAPLVSVWPYPWQKKSHWLDVSEQGGFQAPKLNRLENTEPDKQVQDRDVFSLSEADQGPYLQNYLQSEIAQALQIPLTDLNIDQPLNQLGIGSLVGMELYNRVKQELQVSLPLSEFLKGPSIVSLSELILKRLSSGRETATITQQERPEYPPLSATQKRFWFFEQFGHLGQAYHIPIGVKIQGRIDHKRLQNALNQMVKRHDILRTVYLMGPEGQPFQKILPQYSVKINILDGSQNQWESQIQTLIEAPFELNMTPPFRASLLQDDAATLLLLDMHHLVADGLSFRVIFNELKAAYEDQVLPPLPFQYIDYVLFQEGIKPKQASVNYWEKTLQGIPSRLALPTDFHPSAQEVFEGQQMTFVLPSELVSRLQSKALEEGLTLFALLLSAYYILLYRLTGQNDLVVGTPIAGRQEPGLDALIGPFLNMLPLRLTLSEPMTPQTLFEAVKTLTLDAYDHQDLPFESMVERIAPERNLSHHPIFQTVFALHGEVKTPSMGDLKLSPFEVDNGVARFDLTFTLRPVDEGLQGHVEFKTRLFEPETIRHLIGTYTHLLKSLCETEETPLHLLPLGAESRLQGEIQTVNFDVLEKIKSQPKERLALLSQGVEITYKELWAQAEKMAGFFQSQGAKRIGCCLTSGPQMVVVWLGAWLSGAAYIPLDPVAPEKRLFQQLKLSAADLCVQERSSPSVICPTFTPEEVLQMSAPSFKRSPLSPSDEAYLIFTSGSTGEPKGVPISHGNLANLLTWHHLTHPLGIEDTVSQMANPSFDAATWEVWPALSAGATLCFTPPNTADSLLIDWFLKQKITQAFIPSEILERLLPLSWPEMPLKQVLTGGSALRSYPEPRHPFALFNHYGPTENTVVTTMGEIPKASSPRFPLIGSPIFNTQIEILDDHQAPVPPGFPGELWVSGASLSSGYINSHAGFSQREETSFYSTGDRVRLSGGQIQFLGRTDAQIQLRGMRLELGEVEFCLLQHPEVEQACVLEREQQIWAFTSPNTSADLKSHLGQYLPSHFLPAQVLSMPALPLTSRGKVDSQTLFETLNTQGVSPFQDGLTLPDSQTEIALAQIWQGLLKQDIYRETHFFDAGGHSLLAMDLVHQVAHKMGLYLPMAQVFYTPELSALAQFLSETETPAWAPLETEPLSINSPFPLTEVQQAYWVGRRADMDLGQVSAHAYLELEFETLDIDKLTQVLRQLIEYHPMLRAIVRPDGQQVILPEVPPYVITRHDFRQNAETQLNDLRGRLSHEVRPADQWPLYAFEVSEWQDKMRLHCSLDALILDATSMGLLARQMTQLYQNPDFILPSQEASFRDYIVGLKGLKTHRSFIKAKEYWQSRLSDFARAPALPQGREHLDSPQFKHLSGHLPHSDWQQLKSQAQTWGVTPNVLLISAFASVLGVFTAQERFTLNLTTFQRWPLHPDVMNWVGDFTTLTLLEVERTPEDFLTQTQALQNRLVEDLDAGLYGGVSFLQDLRQAHGMEAALMPVVFTSLIGAESFEWPLGGTRVYQVSQTPQVSLDHQTRESEEGLFFDWDYLEGRYPEGLIEGIFELYCQLLKRLTRADMDTPYSVSASALLPENHWQARHQLNTFEQDYSPQVLHRAIFSQPNEAIAIETPKEKLSYGDLKNQAWALAKSLDIESETPVAVLMQKGPRQIVAVLAILLAGGVYIPIQPEWPQERKNWLVNHCEVPYVLADTNEVNPQIENVQWISEFPEGHAPELAELENKLSQVAPSQRAYIIFTSGSTGQPKGVMLSHESAMNTIQDIWSRFDFSSADVFFGLSALSFDLSVFDIFGPLSYGASLVLPDPHALREPSAWLALCQEKGVTVWNSVPTLMKMLAAHCENHPERELRCLKTVMLSGDWIPLALPDSISEHVSTKAQIYSLGGATEAAIWSIYYPIHKVESHWRSIPYGYPLTDQPFYILDKNLNPCANGVSGDLYIGGKGVAQGYFKDPEKTDAKFLLHPETNQRIYKTGDQGRYWPDGTIEFLGRTDFQVKIQGYRIELGEIESALETHPEIGSALVLARGERLSEKHLVAYLSPEKVDTLALSEWLSQHLPSYMIPREFIALSQFPMLSSGKIDRHALPQISPSQDKQAPIDSPNLKVILSLAQTVLERESLDPYADLLSLGVNSVDMVRLGHHLEEHFGVTPGVGELFQLRTLSALAQYYDRRPSEKTDHLKLILDPEERERFKTQNKGLRALPYARISLPSDDMKFEMRSERVFSEVPCALDSFAHWLEILQSQDGQLTYPSAGGLYPVQVYLYLKSQAVHGLSAGFYYYKRDTHELQCFSAGEIDSQSLHLHMNFDLAREAQFSLFLVADMAAISPIYGADARTYALIEAGAMAQALRIQAPLYGVGTCSVGQVDTFGLKSRFQWTKEHVLLHTLLGGALPSDDWEEFII